MDKYRSHSREVSRPDSLNHILELITDQGNRIARIEVNAHVPVGALTNTSACAPSRGLNAPGILPSPSVATNLPVDNSGQKEQENWK